jgi:GDP-D-mannose dehydratase
LGIAILSNKSINPMKKPKEGGPSLIKQVFTVEREIRQIVDAAITDCKAKVKIIKEVVPQTIFNLPQASKLVSAEET